MQEFANLAYLSDFHGSCLLRVARYCVPSSVKVESIEAHSCFTILLVSGKRPNDVQHLVGHASIQLTFYHDMNWTPSRGRELADGMAEVLGSG